MNQNELAQTILKARRLQRISRFLLSVNIVAFAVLYFNFVSPAFMPDNLLNPAFLKFAESTEFKNVVKPYFDAVGAYNEAPGQHPMPQYSLHAMDPSQFGVVLQVELTLVPKPEASPDGFPRYRYDTNIRVRPALAQLAAFVGFELVLASLLVWGWRGTRDPAQSEFESFVLRGYFFPEATEAINTPAVHEALLRLLARFHVYAKELQAQPRAGHSPWVITDEYDVQHALCALLRTHFDNVKLEETTPSIAGASSRMDFLLVNERTGVEAKMMRDTLTERKLGEQLLLDISHFPAHSQCDSLIFLIYDPNHMIRNPTALREEVTAAARGFSVEVLYSPPR